VELLDVAFARGAKSSSANEDRIVFPLGVACRDLVEEILSAVVAEHGRMALRAVRTLYECVVFARYISINPQLTDSYLATFHTQWAMVLQNIPDAAKGMADAHKMISRMVPTYAAGKRVVVDWSDKSTLKMAESVGIPSSFHAYAFNYTSGFVHPSGMFLLRHLSDGEGNRIEISSESQDQEGWVALTLAHALILNMVALRLKYGASATLQAGLQRCQRDFESVWGYSLPI
jgi:hypothetical protein